MRIGLILSGNIWCSPYLMHYTAMCDKMDVKYEVISWNRDGYDSEKGIQFQARMANTLSRPQKLVYFIGYIKFVKRTIEKQRYDKLVVFGPQLAILLKEYLCRRYKKKYIFDYRDISIEQYRVFQRRLKSVLTNSFVNVVSSPGFLEYLPKGFDFLISHNFDADVCRSSLIENKREPIKHPISILTIGLIRDFSTNSEIIANLSNKDNIRIVFVGRGECEQELKEYAEKIGCKNISFEGYYSKERERDYVLENTFLNIYQITKKTHSTTLTNRLYHALINKRPMIVTKNSIQGELVEAYNLGLSIKDCVGLADKVEEWLMLNDYKAFCERCNSLLKVFLKDQERFELSVEKFMSNNT